MPIKDQTARNLYMKEWQRKRREVNKAELWAYKLEKGCADCGYKEHQAALEFDHVNGDKYENVTSLLGQAKRMWKEVEKCEVVCSNCHSIRTFNRLQQGPLE